MGIFNKLFGTSPTYQDPTHFGFGRYSDAYKEPSKYEDWDLALEAYNEGNYLENFRHFFKYLLDDKKRNVSVMEEKGKLIFSILQGSKKITGEAGNAYFKAEAKIAKVDTYNIAFMRRLLELNYSLKYCRYALDQDENLTIVFYTKTLDASPYKVYYALKELALKSDKQDDILEGEFDSLQSINKDHVRAIGEREKEVKYQFFLQTIDKALNLVDKTTLDLDRYPGAISFVLLDAVYKMDYLIKPEGFIMETIEKMHRIFFESNSQNAELKNRELIKWLKQLKMRSQQQFNDEIYEVVSTFGITMPTGQDRYAELLDANFKNIEWYEKQGHPGIAQSIASYIVGYCLFNYSLPAPIAQLLKLFYHITEEPYFENLGFMSRFWTKNQLSSKAITKQIKFIINTYTDTYGLSNVDVRNLTFENQLGFSKSFLQMLRVMETSNRLKSS